MSENRFKRYGYRVIYADPPWHFAAWSHRGEDEGASQHYLTRNFSVPEFDAGAHAKTGGSRLW